MKRKIFSLLLAATMFSALPSCGGDTSADSTADSTDTTSAETETVSVFPSYLSGVDLGGFTLRFATYEEHKNKFIYVEEATGDVVNDAIYDSISLVCDTFNANIEINFYGDISSDVTNYAQSVIQAGDDAFDLVNGHDGRMWALSLQGLFCDVREFPYQDFTQPWYPTFANDEYEINNKQYIFTSYLSHISIAQARALLFNKGIAQNFQLEAPYDAVRSGTWTLDKLSTMVKSVYQDVNGNSEPDESDVFGMIGNNKLYGWQAAFVNCYHEDDNGIVSLNYDKERFISAAEHIVNLLHDQESAYITGNEPDKTMFVNNQAMFHYNTIDTLTSDEMRASDIDYCILPMPKYDEQQENYVTPSFDQQLAVPITETHVKEVSLLVEALSASGHSTVIPAYFDTALSTKYARDEESVEMLNIIRDTICVDLAYMNTNSGINGLGRAMMYCISNPNAGIASYLDSIESAELATIEKLNAFFAN